MFVPIHNHSEYSALDGLSTVREIAERCVELGCPCCGLTDHGVVSGHLSFGKELAKHGIKPIYGCELYHGVKATHSGGQRDQAHFVAGAMTNEGLRNLWRLTNAASKNFYFVGRVNWDLLEKYNEGLFATSACIAGLVSQGIKNSDMTDLDRYLKIFGDRFYIELHTYPGEEQEQVNLGLVQVAQERGIPLVYANDAHFANPGQYSTHDLYVAMQVGQNKSTPLENRKMWHPLALYMMEESEIRDFLHYLPSSVVDEALDNSGLIGEMCDAELPEIKRHLPVFVPKACPHLDKHLKEMDAALLFIELVEAGIYDRYGENPSSEIWKRAQQEMAVFLEGGLEHYFLQAWDFCRYCDKNDIIRGPGRGSAAGALVAYALRITDIDPLHYGLIFERFYNPGRAKGFPDIDNDFPQGDRRKVKTYLEKRWGEANVRSIGNIVRMKPKAVIDRTYGVCDVTWAEKEAIKKIISGVPDLEILGSDSIGWANDGSGKTIYVMDHVSQEIDSYIGGQAPDRQRILKEWLGFLAVICGRVSGYGVHASGVVVSDTPLDAELPCYWSASQKYLATMFPMTDVESRMFVKQDILGLRTLDTLQDWQRQVKAAGIDVEWSGLELETHPEDMWKMLDHGHSLGIFQIEKGYAKRLCEDFKPRSIEDLSIIVALNRPGPIRSGAPDSFLARRNGDEPITYDHPILEDILEETYGWFLYQEQVIAFFSKLGYDLSEADAIRKILGKKKPEEMKKLKLGEGEWSGRGYLEMALQAGISSKKVPMMRIVNGKSYPFQISAAALIWDKLEDFAKYSFNKSHAVCYAVIAFRTLYAKYHAPAEFIMACIRTNPEEAGDYVAEGRRLGVDVLPPEILISEAEVALKNGRIYYGISNIKSIGKASARAVVRLRERHDISTRSKLEFALEVETKYWKARQAKAAANFDPFKERSPKQDLKSNIIAALENAGAFDNYEERPQAMTLGQIQAQEKELLGVILTDNCKEAFENNGELIEQCDSYDNFQEADHATLPGIITNIRETKTKAANKSMGIVKIEYSNREVEFAVFPQQWQVYKFMWKERTPGIFTLKRSDRGIHFEEGRKLT